MDDRTEDVATDLATDLATAEGWAGAVNSMQSPTEEHVAAAQAALDALKDRADTSASAAHLRSALTNARVRMTAAQLRGMALPEVPPAPSAGYDAEQVAPPEPWEEWTGPRPAMLDEGPGDIADRVATDLAGAAELVTQLGADRPVRPDLVDQSSFLLARVLASGADTIRLLAVQRPGGSTVTVAEPTPDPELLRALGIAAGRNGAALEVQAHAVRLRDVTENLQDMTEERDDLAERVASAESDAADAIGRAVAAEDRVTVLGEELDKAHRELGRALDDLAKYRATGDGGWRAWGEDVVKALGSWAPGYGDEDLDSFRARVLLIARGVKTDADRERAAVDSLRAELRRMVGPIGVGRNGSAPLLVRLQELVSAGKETQTVVADLEEEQGLTAQLQGQVAALRADLEKATMRAADLATVRDQLRRAHGKYREDRGQLAELQDELTKERELTARQRAQLGVRKFTPSNGAERGESWERAAWTGP